MRQAAADAASAAQPINHRLRARASEQFDVVKLTLMHH
jgi:hypothetical protein